jgi:hypothetical protein
LFRIAARKATTNPTSDKKAVKAAVIGDPVLLWHAYAKQNSAGLHCFGSMTNIKSKVVLIKNITSATAAPVNAKRRSLARAQERVWASVSGW